MDKKNIINAIIIESTTAPIINIATTSVKDIRASRILITLSKKALIKKFFKGFQKFKYFGFCMILLKVFF